MNDGDKMNATMEAIERDVKSQPVLLYMKGDRAYPQCGFSARVVQILERHGVPYETRNVLADEYLRQGLKDYSNWPTFPQLYVKGELVGGCDIVTELDAKGELAGLLSG